jgi:hypothetical protein
VGPVVARHWNIEFGGALGPPHQARRDDFGQSSAQKFGPPGFEQLRACRRCSSFFGPNRAVGERFGSRPLRPATWCWWCLLLACKPAVKVERAVPKPLQALLSPEEVARLTDAGSTDAGGYSEALFKIRPLTPVGPNEPEGATQVQLQGERTSPAGNSLVVTSLKRILLRADSETYVAQVAPLLATLEDARVEVFLQHPDAAIAFRVTLRDEAAFAKWLEEPVPGKIRVIHRADGFELQTNIGKLPGGDPRGPTVPLRGGDLDLTMLQRGFVQLQSRFDGAPDVCFVPSFGMEVAQVIRAMAAVYRENSKPIFQEICLVYPRPKK